MAFEVGSVVARVKADVTDFKKGMGEAQNHLEGFKTNLGAVGSMIADFGKQAAVFTAVVGAGLVAVAKKGLDAAAEFEQYDIAFNTLLKDRVKAQQTLKQIEKDAKNTPFELAPLVKANQLLISAGRSTTQARDEVLALGNAVSATGGGEAELSRLAVNLQQIQAVGKASALDIKQFAFAGINIYDLLAKSTGKTVAEIKEMDVSYDMLAKSLKDAAKEGGVFENAMFNQSRTLNGLMSTLSDTINLGLKDILVNSGAFDAIRNGVAALIPMIEAAVPKIVAFFQALPKDPTVVAIFTALRQAFQTLSAWVAENQELVINFLKGLAVAVGALMVIGTITMLVTALLNPLTLVSLAIAGLYALWQSNFWGIRDITMSVITEVMNLFNNILLPGIQAFSAIFQGVWGENQVYLEAVWQIIVGIIQVAWGVVYTLLSVGLALLNGDWKTAWENIKHGAEIAWNGIRNIFDGIISFLGGWGGRLISNLVRPFQDAWNRISDLINKIKDGLDFTKRHSPSVVDIVNRGVNLVNKAMEGLDMGVNMTGTVRPSLPGIGATTGGGMISHISIDLSGAIIADDLSATRITEKIGDSIIQKLKTNIRV